MATYGTLESPFTREYMLFVLQQAGFGDIEFYHSVNGLFRADEGQLTIADVAGDGHERGWNNCIARRPVAKYVEALDPGCTAAALSLRAVERLAGELFRVTIAAENPARRLGAQKAAERRAWSRWASRECGTMGRERGR